MGSLQDPMTSKLGIVNDDTLTNGKTATNGKFSISGECRQYLGEFTRCCLSFVAFHCACSDTGYLDFAMENALLDGKHIIGFEYGEFGYSTAKLFRFGQELIDRFYVKPDDTTPQN